MNFIFCDDLLNDATKRPSFDPSEGIYMYVTVYFVYFYVCVLLCLRIRHGLLVSVGEILEE